MPKVYITTAERQKAATERQQSRESEHVAATARKAMKQKGFTAKKLAAELNISINSVQKFKENPFELNGKILTKLCAATGIVLGVVNDK